MSNLTKITYATKETVIQNPLPDKNKVTASNLNEIKDVVNDIIDFVDKGYINYFDFTSTSTTNIVQTNTWYKLNTNTTEGFKRNGLTHTNNRVTNSVANTKVVKIEGIISISSAPNKEIHLAFFKNGAIVPCSEQSINTGLGQRVSAVPIQCLAELNQNDFVEVWVKNSSGSDNVTLFNINVIVTEL
jgi:hypothetical protein